MSEMIEKPKKAYVLYCYYRNPKIRKAEAEAPLVMGVTYDLATAQQWDRKEMKNGYSFYMGEVPVL